MSTAFRQLIIFAIILSSFACHAAPRKDADGHYMVKEITWLYNGEESGKYVFSYNARGEIIKVEYRQLFDKTRRILSRYGNDITYKGYDWVGKQDPTVKYEYVLDDEGQIISTSYHFRGGGAQMKLQNDYNYEDGRLVYGEWHEYRADNLTDKPKIFLDGFHSFNYYYPDDDIMAIMKVNIYRDDGSLYTTEGKTPEPDIEYWLIENNTNLELSALYFCYAPGPIGGDSLAFLTGWMKLRGKRLVSKYGTIYERTRIDYTFDEYNRPIYAKSVPDTEKARSAKCATAYRIEYVDE